MDTKTLDKTLLEWRNVAAWLVKAKITEMELRNKIVAHFFSGEIEGTHKADHANLQLTASLKLNYKVDEAALDATLQQLPETLRDKLIRWKPDMVAKSYKQLSDAERKVFDECLIIKPGSPTLKVIVKTETE